MCAGGLALLPAPATVAASAGPPAAGGAEPAGADVGDDALRRRIADLEQERDGWRERAEASSTGREQALERELAKLEASNASLLNELSMARRESITARRWGNLVDKEPTAGETAWMYAFFVAGLLVVVAVVFVGVVAARYRVIVAVLSQQAAERAAGAPGHTP
jgi:hypothetical protein